MQIGFEAKRLFLNDRGLGNYARNLLYGLTKYYPENFYHLYSPNVSNKLVDQRLLNLENVVVHQPDGYINKLTSSTWRSVRLGKIASKNKLDIFHGLSQELPKDIRKSGAKSIVTIHDMIFLRHPEFYKPIDRWIYFNKVRFAVHNADHIVAISNQTKNDLVETFQLSEDRISVIYQSCNEVFYSKRTVDELEIVRNKWSLPDNFLLYVGALNENKNVMVILKALAQLKGRMDLPLVVIGHGDSYKKKLIEFASKHQLSGQLLFASEIDNPTPRELSSFYQLASVFIFPSFYEGFGIPILEARFSGTPVIASNSSCLQETGEDDATYFDPNKAEELANLLLDPTQLKKTTIGEGSQFRLKNSTNKYMENYQN